MKKRLIVFIALLCLFAIAFSSVAPVYAATNTSLKTNLTSTQATKIAFVTVGGGIVRAIDLGYKNGVLAYRVEISLYGNKHLVYVNANTGGIVKHKIEYNNSNDNSPIGGILFPNVSVKRAKDIALDKVGGGTVKEVTIERENGKLVYKVKIRHNLRDYVVKINAMTGKII